MNITEVLKKVVAGETLTQEETDFLKEYKEGGGIPKERLDREIEAKKAAEAAKTEAEKLATEAADKLKALEDSKLSDAEKAEKDRKEREEANNRRLGALEQERDEANKKAQQAEFKNNVKDLATKHKVKDVETLQLYAENAELDFSDEGKVSEFIEAQRTARPTLFDADFKPGSGSPPPGGGSAKVPLGTMPKNTEEKLAYIKEHGEEKYIELAEANSKQNVEAFKEKLTAAPPAQT